MHVKMPTHLLLIKFYSATLIQSFCVLWVSYSKGICQISTWFVLSRGYQIQIRQEIFWAFEQISHLFSPLKIFFFIIYLQIPSTFQGNSSQNGSRQTSGPQNKVLCFSFAVFPIWIHRAIYINFVYSLLNGHSLAVSWSFSFLRWTIL